MGIIQPHIVAYYPFESTLPSLGTDASGNGNHGTVYGVTQGVGKIGGAGVFDGTNDWIKLLNAGHLTGANELTILLWAKSDISKRAEMPFSASFNGVQGFLLYKRNTYRELRFAIETTDGNYVVSWNYTTYDWTNVTYISLTYDGESAKIIINGQEKASLPVTGTIVQNYDFILGQFNSAYWYDGWLSKVKILTTALSEQNILREMIGLNAII